MAAKLSVKKALAGLPLVLNACGGGDDSGPDYTPNEPGQGIWKGGFSSQPISVSGASGSIPLEELDKIEQIGLGVFTSSSDTKYNRAFFYDEDNDFLYANSDPGVFSSGGGSYSLTYTPDVYQAGTRYGSVNFGGNPNISTSITGAYTGYTSGNYGMNFDKQYFDAANINQFNGTWSYTATGVGTWLLDFDCGLAECTTSPGFFSVAISGTLNCTGRGELKAIGGGSKNEYEVTVALQTCNSTGFQSNYYGVASVIDGAVANDTLLIGMTNSVAGGLHGFFVKAVKN